MKREKSGKVVKVGVWNLNTFKNEELLDEGEVRQ